MKKLITFGLLIILVHQSEAQFQTNGNASSLGGGCYQLTPNLGNQHGSVWNVNQINLSLPFDFAFSVFLGCSDGGADGICFGLQPNSTSIGTTGNGMGFGGVSPSLGVFIDTYQNSTVGDPTYDHISLNQNGDINHLTANNLIGPIQASASSINIEDCVNHTLRIRWDPVALTYTVWFDGVLRMNLVGNDIINTIFGGDPNVYWGFTGGTGALFNQQQFCVKLVSNYQSSIICQGTATQFNDSSYSSTAISSWQWDFGDGTPLYSGNTASTYQNPTHTYGSPGTYTAHLTITDSGNDTSTIAHLVKVIAYPIVSAIGGVPICSGQTLSLTGSVTGGAPSYSWSPTINISDPASLTPDVSPTVTTTYTLTATNAPGCTTIDSTTVSVTTPSTANFVYIGSPFCQSGFNPVPFFLGGGVAGTFYAQPAGLSIVPSTGAINLALSTPGTYLVTDSIPATGACGAVLGTYTITISPVSVATFSYPASPYCNNGANAIPSFTGNGVAGTFSAPAGLVFVSTATGEIDVVNSTPGNYTITNTVSGGGCPTVASTASITISALPAANFIYPSDPYCQSAGTASPFLNLPAIIGTFSSQTGIVIDSLTGNVDLMGSVPGQYAVTNTIVSANGCPMVQDVEYITITAMPYVAFNYTGSPFCQSPIIVSPNFPSNAQQGLIYSNDANVVVDIFAGSIDVGSSLTGTYTIYNFVSATGGCPDAIDSTSIAIVSTYDASFSYTGNPYCPNGTNPSPTLSSGASSGIYTSTTGLVIDSLTGVVNTTLSTPGIYIVTNTVSGSGFCPQSIATASITISAFQNSTFSYVNSPYCTSNSNPLPSLSPGASAGTFTSTTGLFFISNITGEIDLTSSTPGTYLVTNTVSSSGACPPSVSTAQVIITAAPDGSFSFTGSPYCQSGSNPLPIFTTGVAGSFSSSPSGLTINTSTGLITLSSSMAGAYTITNTIAATAGCNAVTATGTVTIDSSGVASFTYTNSPYCSNGTNPLPSFTGGGVAGTFTAVPTNLSINSTTGLVDLAGSPAGTYTITNSLTAGACPAASAVATIVITALPEAGFGYPFTPDCQDASNPSPTYSGAGVAGIFTSSNGLTLTASTGLIDLVNSTPGTYTVTNTIAAAAGCAVVSSIGSITINALQNASFAYPSANFCRTGTTSPVNVITNGGTFSSTTGLTITPNSGFIDLGASTTGSYVITYTTPGPCAASATYSITITNAPNANAGSDLAIDCSIGSVTLNGASSSSGGTISYAWTTTNGNIVSGGNSVSPIVNQPGTYTLTVTNSATPNCPATDVVTVTGTSPTHASFVANPAAGIPPLTVNFTNMSTNASAYAWLFPGGTPMSSTLMNPTVIYTNAGTYTAYLTTTNSGGCSNTDSMKILVYDDYTVVIPNVFSPNGDNNNDLFVVSSSGVATLTGDIYDRWGLKVFSFQSVNEGWDGHTTSGQMASEGTYYYVIKTTGFNGSEHEDKGFITLLR